VATISAPQRALGRVEFTVLLSLTMSLAALGIDIMLPALGAIRSDYGLAENSTAAAALVTVYVIGLALPQVIYGPLSDRFGRKPLMNIGFAIYVVGALAAALAPTFGALLVARFIWGVGAAGPRGLSIAVVRDRYSGNEMARAMSFIFAVFVVIPIVAPTIGAALVSFVDWRAVLAFCAVWGFGVAIWAIRLPESLHPEYRMELRMRRLLEAAREVATNRLTAGYTLALTFSTGLFVSYIASSEIIISDVFDLESAFPIVFGAFAVVLLVAMLTNGAIVGHFGTRRVSHAALVAYLLLTIALVILAIGTGGTPSFWSFALVLAPMLGCHALMMPNFNTIAMLPMGHIAGTASSLMATFSLAVGALLGAILDQAFNTTILPFALGALVYGIGSLGAVLWAERGRLFVPLAESEGSP